MTDEESTGPVADEPPTEPSEGHQPAAATALHVHDIVAFAFFLRAAVSDPDLSPYQRGAANHIAWEAIRPHLLQVHADHIRIQRAECAAALAAGALLPALESDDEPATDDAAGKLEAALDEIEALNMEQAFDYSGHIAALMQRVREEISQEPAPGQGGDPA